LDLTSEVDVLVLNCYVSLISSFFKVASSAMLFLIGVGGLSLDDNKLSAVALGVAGLTMLFSY
jgi:hypothetical protein